MSIKIYEGLIAVGDANPFELAKLIRSVLEPLFFAKAHALVEELKEHPDQSLKKALFLPKDLDKLPHEAMSLFAVIDMLYKYPLNNFSPADIGYEVVLMPSAVDSKVLALVFSADRSYRKALLDAEVFAEFGYWDNVDVEEGVTPEEWLHREKSWGHLIHEDNTPATIGLMLPHPGYLAYSMWSFYSKGEVD